VRPYGCHNAARPQAGEVYPVQYGWTLDGRRDMIACAVMDSAETCRYDEKAVDPRCVGCREAI
jgi:hypothetical protein